MAGVFFYWNTKIKTKLGLILLKELKVRPSYDWGIILLEKQK